MLSPDLYPHQREAVTATLASLEEAFRSVLVVMPTGTGKTRVFAEVVREEIVELGGNVLVLTHREEILDQARQRLRDDVEIYARREKAEHRADPNARCVVASVATLSQPKRLGRWRPGHFTLIVIDEAHHAVAPTWLRIFEYFDGAKLFGVTATPDRADCRKLGALFQHIAFEYSIRDAIADGRLCPVRQRFVRVEGLDYSQIRTVARDLKQSDLDSVLLNDRVLRLMAEPTAVLVEERPAIVFCVSVPHAYAFAELLRGLGKRARAMDGTATSPARKEAVSDFRAGRIQYLVTCALYLEGFDAPKTSAIVMARPTLSRALYAQAIGRGLRVAPGKFDCIVLDFVGNSGKHKLVHSTDIIDPDANDKVTERAEQILEEREDLTITDALQLALLEIETEDARAILEREAQQKKDIDASFEVEDVDPFLETETGKVFSMMGLKRQDDRWGRALTEKQEKTLRSYGVDPEQMNHLEAKRLLDKLMDRARADMARPKQVRLLMKHGLDGGRALSVSFDDARKMIDQLRDNGWRAPEQWG